METIELKVAGMTCASCANSVSKALKRVAGVQDVHVDLARGAASVTVIAMDAELADVSSTALMVGGPDRFAEIVKDMGIDYALLVSPTGALQITPAMQERLRQSNGGKLPRLDWHGKRP